MRGVRQTTALATLGVGILILGAVLLFGERSGDPLSSGDEAREGSDHPMAATRERSPPRNLSDPHPAHPKGVSGEAVPAAGQSTRGSGGPRIAVLHVALDGPGDADLSEMKFSFENVPGEAVHIRENAPAEFDLEVPPLTEFRVWLLSPTLTSERIDVSPLRAGERRQVRIAVWRRGAPFWGRVVEQGTGRPIAGAGVEFTEEKVGLYSLTTDAAGCFQGSLDAGGSGDIDIAAEGYESISVFVLVNDTSRVAPRTFALSRGAALRGRVLDENGRPVVRAAVVLEFDSLGDAALPFEAFHWGGETVTDEEGRYRLKNLSSGRRFTVSIVGSTLEDDHKVLAVDRPAVLVAGEERQLDFRLRPRGSLRGRVLDQHGLPVAHLSLVLLGLRPWMQDTVRRGHWYLDPEYEVIERAEADDAGAFDMADLPPGRWFLALGREGPEDVASRPMSVVVPVGSTTRVDLRVVRGLAIRGRVVTPPGLAHSEVGVSFCPVGCLSKTSEFVDSEDCGFEGCRADGAYELTPLVPGDYRVSASAPEHRCLSRTRRVAAGTEDLVLRLQPGNRLHGRAVDASTGKPVCCVVTAVGKNVPAEWCGSDDGFEFELLLPGLYDLYAWSGDGRVGFLTEVPVNQEAATDDVVLRMRRGAVLEVAVAGSEHRYGCAVRPAGMPGEVPLLGFLHARGLPLSVTVPAGSVEVVVYESAPEPTRVIARRNVRVSAGQRSSVLFHLGRK